MQEIIDFLKGSPAFFVATLDDDNQPRVRPFGFVMEWEGKLTLATSNQKPVYRQLSDNPQVEICSFNPGSGQWVRITGEVTFFQSVDANRKIFEIMPSIRSIYKTEENPALVCLSIDKGEASFYSFSSADPVKVIRF